jgi:hypothetical protein
MLDHQLAADSSKFFGLSASAFPFVLQTGGRNCAQARTLSFSWSVIARAAGASKTCAVQSLS